MNATQLAVSAYGRKNSSLKTDRGIEYEVFAQVTRQIQTYAKQGKREFPKLAQALHRNRQLWATLALDVASEENSLDKDVRAKVFYLSEFTNLETKKVLAGERGVDALTQINLAIMRGLSQPAIKK